jgi:hypothetical protein
MVRISSEKAGRLRSAQGGQANQNRAPPQGDADAALSICDHVAAVVPALLR